MHFQGREAGIDRMPAINGRHTGNRHIGVADHLEFLKSMARHDVVERPEILVVGNCSDPGSPMSVLDG